jgi:hypothetical protein
MSAFGGKADTTPDVRNVAYLSNAEIAFGGGRLNPRIFFYGFDHLGFKSRYGTTIERVF